MSFIARCPACQTWYKVVPDQLRISDGWVRCGMCGEIFDVSRQLIDAESELPADPAQTEVQQFLPEPAMVEHLLPPEEEALVMPQFTQDLPPDVQPDRPTEASWDSAALLIKPSRETEAEAGTQSEYEPARKVAEPVAFMRAPVVGQDLHRKRKRLLWAVLGVCLLLGLLVQGLYRERDQLAALKPEFKPALQTFCELLRCSISPIQRIDAFVLESATLHQVDQETFQLHLVVKNKTQLELALPAVELTLSDLTDQPVMRRVFVPSELGAKSNTVTAASEWSATANLRVQADTARPRALGYRLLLFYP